MATRPSVPARATAATARSRPGARRIAAIDIGSNSIREIVADVSAAGAIQIVDEMKAAPRLAAGLGDTGQLAEESMAAAIEALGRMTLLARQLGAKRIDAVATSAVRDAANGRAFVARVRRETGLRVRVVDGLEEARLGFRSAMAHFDLGAGRTAVLDIGGGSAELALSADGVLEHLASTPLGAVRLTEAFLADGSGRKALRELRRHVRAALRDALPAREWRGAQLIGSGGTFTSLAGMHLARQGVSAARGVHAARISRGEVEHVLESLAALTPDERRSVAGLNPERADIIVAGLAVTAEVMVRLEARAVVVSEYGIREGILLEAAQVAPVVADPGEARARSVRELAERCHFEAPHAEQVRRLALRLFDALGARLALAPADRDILADAALLHDIGYHINYDRHHKHSYHLIVHARLLGIAPTEQVAIANVARYHRGAPPRRQQATFAALDKDLRRRVRRLAALLRVADGLDRGHTGAVADVRVRWTPRALRIAVVPRRGAPAARLELWGAHRKSQLLAEVAERPVEIVAPDGAVLSSEDLEDGVA